MKSQRRRQLKTNVLAQQIEHAPDLLKQYGGKILLLIVVAALASILVRRIISSRQEAQRTARSQLAIARDSINELSRGDAQFFDPESRAANRRRLSLDAQNAIRAVRENTSDTTLLAEASIADGDLNWHLANLPPIPGSATRSSLNLPETPDAYLKRAQDAYQFVLNNYPDDHFAAAAAHFGLAAIAEDRNDWNTAQSHYNAVINDPAAYESYKTIARERLDRLAEIQKPVFVGAVTTRPMLEDLFPATTHAASQPSTQAATRSATQAISQPATKPAR